MACESRTRGHGARPSPAACTDVMLWSLRRLDDSKMKCHRMPRQHILAEPLPRSWKPMAERDRFSPRYNQQITLRRGAPESADSPKRG